MISELAKEGIKLDAIQHCSHSPDSGCNCRKPARGMIDQALEKVPVDFKYSFFVGDKTSDVKLGKDIGCKTFLVRTGKGGSDKKYDVHPTYEVDNLLEASKIIIESWENKIPFLNYYKNILNVNSQ